MSKSENLWLDDKFGLAYDNEIMQKKMINTARNWVMMMVKQMDLKKVLRQKK